MLLLSVTACDCLAIQRARQIELSGEWGWTDDYSKFPESCGTLLTLRYFSNGKYTLPGEVGTWRLEGNVLTEAATELLEILDEETADRIGKTYVSTIQWVDYNTFLKRYSDGDVIAFHRCPNWN